MTTGLRTGDALSYVSGRWPADVLPLLTEYARIPSLSPAYDPDWQAHGRLDDAAEMYAAWARSRPLDGAVVDVVRLDGLTPTVVVDVPPATARRPAPCSSTGTTTNSHPSTAGAREGVRGHR